LSVSYSLIVSHLYLLQINKSKSVLEDTLALWI